MKENFEFKPALLCLKNWPSITSIPCQRGWVNTYYIKLNVVAVIYYANLQCTLPSYLYSIKYHQYCQLKNIQLPKDTPQKGWIHYLFWGLRLTVSLSPGPSRIFSGDTEAPHWGHPMGQSTFFFNQIITDYKKINIFTSFLIHSNPWKSSYFYKRLRNWDHIIILYFYFYFGLVSKKIYFGLDCY